MTLVKYRLNTWMEIEQYLLGSEAEQFKIYLDRIYKALMAMKPKDEIHILKEVAPVNREKFIKTVCLFIAEGNTDYSYSDDYSIIRRSPENSKIVIERLLHAITLKRKLKKDELDKAEKTNNKTA